MPSKSKETKPALPAESEALLATRPYLYKHKLTTWGIDIGKRKLDITVIPYHGSKAEHFAAFMDTSDASNAALALSRAYAYAYKLTTDVGWAFPPASIFIEEPFGKGAAKLMPLLGAYTAGVAAALTALYGRLPVFDSIVPPAWKKAVGLPGNATKPQIADLYAKFMETGILTSAGFTQDQADSYFIALACRGLWSTDSHTK